MRERPGLGPWSCKPLELESRLEHFLICLSTIAIAEMGDRTQLLSLLLAARFRRPWPILAGVLCATVANHAAAAFVGERLGRFLTPRILDAAVGVSMVAMALWALKPDTLAEEPGAGKGKGAFAATLVTFFIAEIGDKTQIATVALAAGYANIPVVFFGKAFCDRLPLKAIHYVASVLFLALSFFFLVRALPHG